LEPGDLKEVIIYTDGAAAGNPGPGGYGAILLFGNHRRELSGGFRLTTNNRMEMIAAIMALEALKTRCRVKLYSDSEYLVRAMSEGWAARWRSRNWWRTIKERAANADLWQRLLELAEQHEVEFIHVKGHAGHAENERCDQLAEGAARLPDRRVDVVFEAERASGERGASHDIQDGEPCRKCSTPVVKRAPRKPPKPGQAVYYEYYFYCPTCQTLYMVEEGKRERSAAGASMLFSTDEEGAG
jgi:ribonuclease HI